ncbi:MAG: aryl-sulfate sulfotransferase, partial [Bryobacteraceae bacterium]
MKNETDQSVGTLAVPFMGSSRVTTQPTVNGTRNPLVALYSAPSCPAGSSMRVRFWKPGDALYHFTPTRGCTAASSMNFYIAGMTAHTTYSLQQDLMKGPMVTVGPLLSFTTGNPTISVSPSILAPAQPPTSQTEGTLLFAGLDNINAAIDLTGKLVWYYSGDGAYITRTETGGNMFLTVQPVQNPNLTRQQNSEKQLLREIDLAGNTILETNAARIGELLGYPVNLIHHDIFRLPNGNLVFLTATERMADQGSG